MRGLRLGRLGAAAVAALLLPAAAAAQSGDELGERIAAASGDRVTFHFDVEPDVRVCENGFSRGDQRRFHGSWNGGEPRCVEGPMEVLIERRAGVIHEVDYGPTGSHAGARDLGRVDPLEASAFLLTLHARGARSDAAEDGLAGAVVARGAEPGHGLIELGRNRSLDSDLRQAALFWASQEVAEGIDTTLAGIAADEAEDQDVRDAAVFGLSQRPDAEAVPALMDLALSAPHAQTRKTALFWLSQSDDGRVPDFFAQLILGSGG